METYDGVVQVYQLGEEIKDASSPASLEEISMSGSQKVVKEAVEAISRLRLLTIEGAGGIKFPEEILDSLTPGMTIRVDESGAVRVEKPADPPSRPLLSTKEAIDAFLGDCKFRCCSERTIYNYGSVLHRVLGPFDHVPTDHKVIRRVLSNFKGETMATYRRYLFGFYHFMQEEYGLANPMPKVPKPRQEKRLPDHLNPEQKRQLEEASLSLRDRALLSLFAESALRPGEVADSHRHPLRFCDIYQDHVKVAGKRGERIVPVTVETTDRLFALQGSRPSDSPVFLGNNGQALTHWGIRKVVQRAFAAAGIRGVKACPYTLRHSFGGDFLAQGGDLAMLQRILGHANIKTTMIYTHIADKAVMDSYRQHGPGAITHPLFALEEMTSPPDAARSIPELLDEMIALGKRAQQVSQMLGGNGHRPEQLKEIIHYLEHQAKR